MLLEDFNFKDVVRKFEQEKVNLPLIVGNLTKNYFVQRNFNAQQFNGVGWAARKKDTGKSLLVNTGRLRQDLINSLRVVSWNRIELYVNNPYGGYHNYGTDKMPMRKFVGHTEELGRQQLDRISKEVNKIFK
jgi:phage gpG-like protein